MTTAIRSPKPRARRMGWVLRRRFYYWDLTGNQRPHLRPSATRATGGDTTSAAAATTASSDLTNATFDKGRFGRQA